MNINNNKIITIIHAFTNIIRQFNLIDGRVDNITISRLE